MKKLLTLNFFIMKNKLYFLLVLMFLATVTVTAQNTFVKGDKVVNLGLGIGSTLYTGSYYTSHFPPISASLEFGIKDELFDAKSSLGVGGYVGYTGAKWDYNGWGWKYSSIVIGPRAALHYQLLNKLDTYTGLMLGYNIVSAKEFGTGQFSDFSTEASGLAFSWFLGGRYYFSEKFAGLLELGYGVSYLNIGIALKL
jgi:hypothetical protein